MVERGGSRYRDSDGREREVDRDSDSREREGGSRYSNSDSRERGR